MALQPWKSVMLTLSQWCYPTISSSVILFSSHLQSFPPSWSFPMSQVFASGGQSIGAAPASASVLLMNIQDWFPLGLTALISLQSKGLSRVFSNTTVQKHQFFGTQCLYSPTLTSNMTTGKTIALTIWSFVGKVISLLFNELSTGGIPLWRIYQKRRTDSFEKTPMLGKIEGGRRRGWQRMRRLDGITYSMDISSGSWWWTGRPGMLQFMGSQRAGHDWATELNWSLILNNTILNLENVIHLLVSQEWSTKKNFLIQGLWHDCCMATRLWVDPPNSGTAKWVLSSLSNCWGNNN